MVILIYLIFFINFDCFLAKKATKNMIFCWIFFCWEASKYSFSENFIKRFVFCKFSSLFVNFGSILALFCPKNAEIEKQFFVAFSFVGKLLHIKFQENFIKRFGFCQFSSFLVNFGYFLAKKSPKSKIGICGESSFTNRHMLTKFQKISLNCSQDNLWRTNARTTELNL